MAKAKQATLLRDYKAKQILAEMASKGATVTKIAATIAEKTGYKYHPATIRRAMRRMHLDTPPEAMNERIDMVTGPALSAAPPDLPIQAKADWFRQQFRDSHLYPTLQQQFEPDEINTYMEEYGQICCQFEDLVVSEFFQIDDFLKHRILINRQLVQMKQFSEQIDELKAWFAGNPIKDEDDAERKRERVERFRLFDSTTNSLHKANERYDKLVAERQKIYQNLAATRRDRLDDLKGTGDSFFTLLTQIQQNDRARAQQGQYAELTRMAAEEIQEAFREPITFPDGKKDAIILDEQTAYLDSLDAVEPEDDEEEEMAADPEEDTE